MGGKCQIVVDNVHSRWTAMLGNSMTRLAQLKAGTAADATALQNLSYQYSAAANVTQIVDAKAGETVNYYYDELNRLIDTSGAYGHTFTYNAAGNLLRNDDLGGTLSYDTVKKHQVISTSNGDSYSYDGAGNMTGRTVGGTSYTLTYDQENRLTGVSGGATAGFVYDGDGKRVKGTVGISTTAYIGDYYEWNGTAKQYYAIGGARVAMKDNGALRYLLSDHLGSTALNVSQALVKDGEVRYYAYGSDRYTSGSVPTTYRYTGQRAEQGIGLYFYNARWYDPALGRFAQADTIVPQPGNPQSLNRYSYVLNNPLRYVDPSGRCAADPSEDPECWAVYNQVSKKWGSGIPDDLWRWSIMQLINLRVWMDRGFRFTGEQWTSAAVSSVLTGLDRVLNAVGSTALNAIFGLQGSATFALSNITRSVQQGADESRKLGGGWGNRHGIDYNFGPESSPFSDEYMIYVTIHESGHVADTQLGLLWYGGDTNWSEWSVVWLRAGQWRYVPGSYARWISGRWGEAASAYALSNPGEDFAETFTWYVHKESSIGWGREPGEGRQDALRIAFGYFR